MQSAVPVGVGAMAAVMRTSAEELWLRMRKSQPETGKPVELANYNSSTADSCCGIRRSL